MKNSSKVLSLLIAATMLPAIPVFAAAEEDEMPLVDAEIEAPVGVFEDITDSEEFFIESESGEPVTALLSKVDFVAGDANLDGVVNNVDIAYTQRYLASWSGYDKTQVSLGALDLDGDGKVNAIDAITLNRHFAAWEGYESITANSFVSEQNTTTFVISATPKQYRAVSYSGQAYNSASDTGVTYVGIQKLHGGLPSGTILYVPCEDLGIPEEDVESYFNRSVDVVNYYERSRTFTDAILGDEPVVVTNADVTLYEEGYPKQYKLTIGDVKYTVGNFIEGTELLNEMVISGLNYIHNAKKLSVDEDGNVLSHYGDIVGKYEYESSGGVKYYYCFDSCRIVDEFAMLDMYGIQVTGKDAPFTCTDALDASELYNEAYTLELYDDDHDGLYERAVYNPIYMGVYYTYPATISGAERQADGLLSELGYIRTADFVYYTDPAAQETGAISVFTYNGQLNRVNVIDVLEVQTGELEKVDARGFTTMASSSANTVKLTIDGEQYTLAYDIPNYSGDTSDWTVNGAQLGAYVVEYGLGDYNLADLGDKAFLDLFNTKAELELFVNTALIGEKFMYVAYNGYILMLSAVPTVYEYVVVDEMNDFDLGEIYLDLYHDGEIETGAVVTEMFGKTLANLSNTKFTDLISTDEYFTKGVVYAAVVEDGEYALDGIIDGDSFGEYGLLNAKLASDSYVADAGIITDTEDDVKEFGSEPDMCAYGDGITYTIDFEDGSSVTDSRYATLVCGTETLFYVIENADDTIITVFEGVPADGSYIEFGADTLVLADKLGDTAGTVIVVDPVSCELSDTVIEDIEPVEPEVTNNGGWVLMNLSSGSTTEVVYADDIGLDDDDYAEKYYAYYGDFVNLDNGSKVSVIYSEEKLTKSGSSSRIVEIDENGVAVEADGTTVVWNAENTVDNWNYIQGTRDYALYGITDVNTNGATTAAHEDWGVADGAINYYDWLYFHKEKIDNDGCEKVPTSILDVELERDIIEIDEDDGYYIIDNLCTATLDDICDEGDAISFIKVVDLGNLGTVRTGDDALAYLANAPQICWMGGDYFDDGIIVFVVATTVSDK